MIRCGTIDFCPVVGVESLFGINLEIRYKVVCSKYLVELCSREPDSYLKVRWFRVPFRLRWAAGGVLGMDSGGWGKWRRTRRRGLRLSSLAKWNLIHEAMEDEFT